MKQPTLNQTFPLLIALLFAISPVSAEVNYSSPLDVDGEEFEIGNLLEWSTASEDGSAFFFVEKSLDGITFENIGKVEAAGDSDEELAYRYMDIQVTDKEVFYRLRQTDEDGTESLSQAVNVIKELQNQFMIINYSEVMTDKLFSVTIDALEEGSMTYSLESYRGEVIFKTNQRLENGLNNFEINLEDEKEGKYRVVFQLGEEVEKLNIVKLEDELKKKPNVASKKSSTGG